MKNTAKILLTLTLALFLGACAQNTHRVSSVEIVDSADRAKLDTDYGLSDIIAMSENLTNKMLQHRVFAGATQSPRIVVGKITNNTHDENLRVIDLHDRLQEVLLNSGQVRVLDRSANSFDYIMHTEITSGSHSSSDGQRKVDYTVKIKLFKVNGELIGQWSDDTSFFKNR